MSCSFCACEVVNRSFAESESGIFKLGGLRIEMQVINSHREQFGSRPP